MDFSTQSIGINESQGEMNYSPVPVRFLRDLDKTGIRIHVFYENITSRKLKEGMSEKEPLRTFQYYCLFHLIAGDGFLYDPERDETQLLSPGDAVLLPQGVPHRYGGYRKPFTEDSICFSGPAADALYRSGLIRKGVIRIGRERRLLPVIRLIRDGALSSQFEATALLMKLLIELHRESLESREGSAAARLKLLMEEVRTSRREWSVSEMAEYANMSENALRKSFHKMTGSSPSRFLEQLWLNRAMDLVCSTNLPLLEVAKLCSSGDPYYFFRRFRKLTGGTPAYCRRVYGRGRAGNP